jgi:hypothetical protein
MQLVEQHIISKADPRFAAIDVVAFKAKNGHRIQADVNGSYNIVRKALPDSFGQGIEAALAVRPVGLPISTVVQPRALDRAAVLPTRA